MRSDRWSWISEALGWLVLPLIPTLLGVTFYGLLNLGFVPNGGPDPHDWDWSRWITQLGPLIGYGFLAGATLGTPDDPASRGFKGLVSRRSLWVALGPWTGCLIGSALVIAVSKAANLIPEPTLSNEWLKWSLNIAFWVAAVGLFSYGWLPIAVLAVRRARRLGVWGTSIKRGIAVALGFVGSLFGSFWAITEAWRYYFFDSRIVPILVPAVGLIFLSGCANTATYGEVRRRELFQAMLTAWLLGLALAWRWWSRSRSKPD